MSGSSPRFGEAPLHRILTGGGGRLRGLYSGAMLTWSVIYGLPLATGALISILLDKAAQNPLPSAVWTLLWVTVGLMCLRAVTLFIGLQLTFKLIFQMSAWIKIQVLGPLLGRPAARGPALGNGEILNRLRDDSDEIGGLLEWTTDLIYRSVLTVIAVTILAVVDTVMTIPLVLLLGGIVASVAIKRRVAQAQAEARLRQGRIGATIADSLTGIRDLRLSATLEGRLHSLNGRFAERRTFQVRHQLYSDLLSDLFRNLVMIGSALVLLTMSVQLTHGGFTVGKLTLFLTYSSWLSQQMYFFGKIVARYQGGTVSYGRLNQVIPPGDVAPEPPKLDGALRELRVVELTCLASEGGGGPSPVSFTVRPGELVAITGELGSGKSMVVRSLLGLQADIEGHLSWDGHDVTGDERFLRTPNIGYARQAAKFLRGTVRENLLLGRRDITEETMARALEAVELRPGSAELPLGLDTYLDSGDAGQLSGGQRQRLSLARMLCRPAAVYVVDDCDSSLDGPTAGAIWQRLLQDWPAAWIVVSHNSDLLASADTVVEINRAGVGAAAQTH